MIRTGDGPSEPAPRAAAGTRPATGRARRRRAGLRRAESGPGRADWVPGLVALAVLAGYLIISLSRYLRLDPGSWDLGIFTEYMRQLAHLHAPVVNIHGPGFNLLGDHFQPIAALIVPFFLLFPSPVTLLVAQAAVTAVSVIPVSRAAATLLGRGAGRAVGLAYGLSWGLVQMVDFDFHEIAFAVPLLAFSLSALIRGRNRAAVAWALPLVLVKEDQGLTVVALGLVMVMAGGTWRREPAPPRRWLDWADDPVRGGLVLIVWGLAWSALAIMVIIPHFNAAHQYPYWPDGGALRPAAAHLSPGTVAGQFGASWVAKLRTTLLIGLPVAFCALGSPAGAVALPSLALRFVSINSAYWGSGYHYNATVMPIVFLAAVDALARARRAGRWTDLVATRAVPALMVALAVVIAPRFPWHDLWQPGTYEIGRHVQAEDAALARVPPDTTVEATLTMIAPLAARDDTYWIGTSGNPAPRWIVFDESNSGWSPAPANPLAFVEQRHGGVTYRQVFLDNDVYVFRRAGGTSGR